MQQPYLGHVELVHRHLAGLAADGPQMHHVAARNLLDWGVGGAPSVCVVCVDAGGAGGGRALLPRVGLEGWRGLGW
jgi:hypothetical protein